MNNETFTMLISIISLILGTINFFGHLKEKNIEVRDKNVERYVLHYRDDIRDTLDSLLSIYDDSRTEDAILFNREHMVPLFDKLKVYIHDVKFFDQKYNTKIYENIIKIINDYETEVFRGNKIEHDKYSKDIKTVLLSTF